MLTRRCCLLVASLCLFLAGGAAADEGYRSARVSDVTGELAVRGEDEDDVSYVERNAIIRAGDVLWTDDRSNAEIELERGAWVRLAEDTKLEVRDLPPSAEFRLWTGSVYFDLSDRIPDPIRLRTPVGDVDVFPDSVVRIDLSGDESARVSVFNGRAAAIGDTGRSLRLSAGDRAYLEAGRGFDEARRFDREDLDGFDRYHRQRLDYYIARPLPRELDEPLIGAYELQDYGSWVVLDNTRYWRPRCEPDWRPYSSGYWNWVPGFGYSWNDYAPWGYTTSHYGRWLYRPVYGWLWSPTYTWGPAWVHWSSWDNYYGWAPLDPFGRPCYWGGGPGFNVGFGTGSWFIDYRSWSFCPRDQFFFGRHHRRWWPRRGFYAGHEVRIDPGRFRLVRDAHREFGVPRERVRGLVDSERGWSARERVLRLEDRVPQRRQRLIEDRFKTPANRDRERARRESVVERLQRDRNTAVEDRLVRGDEADRLVRFPRGGRSGDDRPGRANDLPNRGNDRDDRLPNRGSRDDNPGNTSREPRERNPLGDRNPGAGNRDNDRPGRQDDRGPVTRKDEPSPPKPPKPKREGADDRDSPFRRGDGGGLGTGRGVPSGTDNRQDQRERERRDADQRDGARRDADRRDADRRDTDRRDTERRDAERRDAERRDADRRSQEQRDTQRRAQEDEARRRAEREAQDRENQRREAERRDAERRDAERRNAERRDAERRDAERRDAERRDAERRDAERRERDRSGPGRRGYSDFPGGTVPATGGNAGGSAGDDRFRRGGGYRDFPGPSGVNPGDTRRSQPGAQPADPGRSPYGGGSVPRTYGGGRDDNSSRYNRGSERPSYTPPAYSPPPGGASPSYGGRSDRGTSGGPSGGRSYSPPSYGSGGGGRSYSPPSYGSGGGRSSGGSSGGSYSGSRGSSGNSGSSGSSGSAGGRSGGFRR